LAAHPSRGFAGRLDSWQQQADERPNNGNHNEQLNERETGACSALQAKLWHVSTRWIFRGTMGRLMKVRLSLNNIVL
jgi:dTDP-4-dehydrorhamnose reductase